MRADIEVELTFLPTEHGGRRTSVASGYRPQFYYGNNDWGAVHTYISVSEVHPGDTVIAQLSFFTPTAHVGKIFEGMPFLIREGNQTVGYGRVLDVLDLEASAWQGSGDC